MPVLYIVIQEHHLNRAFVDYMILAIYSKNDIHNKTNNGCSNIKRSSRRRRRWGHEEKERENDTEEWLVNR